MTSKLITLRITRVFVRESRFYWSETLRVVQVRSRRPQPVATAPADVQKEVRAQAAERRELA